MLISGRGSNLQALIDAPRPPTIPPRSCSCCRTSQARKGLPRAEAASIPTLVVNHKDFASRDDFDCRARRDAEAGRHRASLQRRLHAAAYRSLRAQLVEPPSQHSPLPAARVQGACTPMPASWTKASRSPAAPCISSGRRWTRARSWRRQPSRCLLAIRPDSLAARVLEAEHRLYPLALNLVASGAVRVEGERVVGMTQISDQPPIFSPPFDEAL